MNLDSYVESLATLVENREKYQRVLGQISLEIQEVFGLEGLNALAEELKERHGKTISPSTLRNYGWVEKKTADLPDDIPFSIRREIARTHNPQEWIEKVKQGYSVAEIYRMIKGSPKSKKCPNCGIILNRSNGKTRKEGNKDLVD